MDCIATRIPISETNSFTPIIKDYIDQSEKLIPFFLHTPSISGIKKAISRRTESVNYRAVLVDHLSRQYSNIETPEIVGENIKRLLKDNTFTVTTAHQPNIFTGPLYFIYKIVHVIKLAEHLGKSIPGHQFVPVFYMGSEDADLEELGNFYINGEKFTWSTTQTGSVGMMKVDKAFIGLIDSVGGQLSVLPFGAEILLKIRKYYKEGVQIQQATFQFINDLFGKYGLIVLIPDAKELKALAIDIFKDDLIHQKPSQLVQGTIQKLQDAGYKAQAQPRDINLFYLQKGKRERILFEGGKFKVINTSEKEKAQSFSQEEILQELQTNPEKFSPNVILRAIYQELILPNVVFAGGGGELAYWLQYKELFAHYKVPFPVLVLRNSFLIVEKKWKEKIARLDLLTEDFFKPADKIMNKLVEKKSNNKIRLNGIFDQAEQFYDQLKLQTKPIDVSLVKHIEALKVRSIQSLQELEKKMVRAEKRKFSDQHRQVQSIRDRLFPKNELQERVDNFMPYYALWGKDFIDKLLKYSLGLEQEFVILEET